MSEIATRTDAGPSSGEILNLKSNFTAVYGRLYEASGATTPEEVTSLINPDNDSIQPSQIHEFDITRRDYNKVTRGSSLHERDEAWAHIAGSLEDKKDAWNENVRGSFSVATTEKRKAVINHFTGKESGHTKEDIDNTLYDRFCDGTSNVTEFVKKALEIPDVDFAEVKWLARKLFGKDTAKVVTKIMELESSLNEDNNRTLKSLFVVDDELDIRRINTLEPEERELLNNLNEYFEWEPRRTEATPPPTRAGDPPAPGAYTREAKIRDYEEAIEAMKRGGDITDPATGNTLKSSEYDESDISDFEERLKDLQDFTPPPPDNKGGNNEPTETVSPDSILIVRARMVLTDRDPPFDKYYIRIDAPLSLIQRLEIAIDTAKDREETIDPMKDTLLPLEDVDQAVDYLEKKLEEAKAAIARGDAEFEGINLIDGIRPLKIIRMSDGVIMNDDDEVMDKDDLKRILNGDDPKYIRDPYERIEIKLKGADKIWILQTYYDIRSKKEFIRFYSHAKDGTPKFKKEFERSEFDLLVSQGDIDFLDGTNPTPEPAPVTGPEGDEPVQEVFGVTDLRLGMLIYKREVGDRTYYIKSIDTPNPSKPKEQKIQLADTEGGSTIEYPKEEFYDGIIYGNSEYEFDEIEEDLYTSADGDKLIGLETFFDTNDDTIKVRIINYLDKTSTLVSVTQFDQDMQSGEIRGINDDELHDLVTKINNKLIEDYEQNLQSQKERSKTYVSPSMESVEKALLELEEFDLSGSESDSEYSRLVNNFFEALRSIDSSDITVLNPNAPSPAAPDQPPADPDTGDRKVFKDVINKLPNKDPLNIYSKKVANAEKVDSTDVETEAPIEMIHELLPAILTEGTIVDVGELTWDPDYPYLVVIIGAKTRSDDGTIVTYDLLLQNNGKGKSGKGVFAEIIYDDPGNSEGMGRSADEMRKFMTSKGRKGWRSNLMRIDGDTFKANWIKNKPRKPKS